MPWHRVTIGTFGDISTRKTPTGRYGARTRYRDWDGHVQEALKRRLPPRLRIDTTE